MKQLSHDLGESVRKLFPKATAEELVEATEGLERYARVLLRIGTESQRFGKSLRPRATPASPEPSRLLPAAAGRRSSRRGDLR